jgi:predicted phage tail protein
VSEKLEAEEIVAQDVVTTDINNSDEQDSQTTQEQTDVTKSKKKKHHIAVEKIEKAKELSHEAHSIMEECMKNIDEDLEKLQTQKETLFDNSLNPSELLLEKTGTEEQKLEALPDSEVDLVDPEVQEVEIRDLSSGKFKAIFFSILSGIVLLLAWCYTAVSKLGLPIVPEKIPDMERLNKVLEWTSAQIGQGDNANIGSAIVIISVLFVMFVVYLIMVATRANHNLKVATQTEEAISTYCTQREECQQKMQLIRTHIQETTRALGEYGILLDEQNAKIRRALHFEDGESYYELHQLTRDEIDRTKQLVNSVKFLLSAPIAQSGVLTQSGIETLTDAKEYIISYLEELYKS